MSTSLRPDRTRPHVLVVAAHQGAREHLLGELATRGLQAVAAASLAEAEPLLLSLSIDVVVLSEPTEEEESLAGADPLTRMATTIRATRPLCQVFVLVRRAHLRTLIAMLEESVTDFFLESAKDVTPLLDAVAFGVARGERLRDLLLGRSLRAPNPAHEVPT